MSPNIKQDTRNLEQNKSCPITKRPSVRHAASQPANSTLHSPKDRPLSNDRFYDEDDVWATLARFIREVVPVAEDAGVRIGLHPDDP
ncbi:MAG: hypothetical protein HN611_02845, partial [Gemmatimonadetes bacterium]|nr:hypothetical protein [Gemmatimonadota bacterium]